MSQIIVHQLEELHGKHKGGTAFVVANGPSAGLYTKESIDRFGLDKLVIGCNDVWRVLGGEPLECDYWVMLDGKFRDENHARIHAYKHTHTRATPICYRALDLEHYRLNLNFTRDARRIMREGNEAEQRFKPGNYFHGHCSGVAAVQVAMQAGCTTVYLLGHDLTVTQDATHGFGKRTDHEHTGKYPQGLTFLSGYDLLKRHADELGVRIINLSPISTLKQFEPGQQLNQEGQ